MGQKHIEWTQQERSNMIYLLKIGVIPLNVGRIMIKQDTKGRNERGICTMAYRVQAWLNGTNPQLKPEQAALYQDASTIPPEPYVNDVGPEMIGYTDSGSKMVHTKGKEQELRAISPIPTYAMAMSLDQVVDTAKRVGAKEVNYHGIVIKF